MLATLATCHLFVLKLFCSSWAAAQSNMEAEISGYLSHTAILLASLVGTGCWLYLKAAKGDGPPNFSAASVQLQFIFLLLGILRIAASLAAAGPGLDWPSPPADVLDPRFAQERRFWSVPDLNRIVQDPGPRWKKILEVMR